jgi:hypothetical protein
MKNKKKKLQESISETAISPLSYIVFIDAGNVIGGKSGYLKILFQNETTNTITSWFRNMVKDDNYKKNKDKLIAIASRFSNIPSLKVLFTSLSKLKTASFSQEEREQQEADIQSLIQKISVFIKRRLTEDDDIILKELLSDINAVGENILKKIDSEIESNEIKSDEKEKEPKKEPKKESKISERIKNKLRKKIKEIARTHLIGNKYK